MVDGAKMVAVIGASTPFKEVVVEDDKPVVKEVMNVAFTFDHRYQKKEEFGKICSAFEKYMNDPESYENN